MKKLYLLFLVLIHSGMVFSQNILLSKELVISFLSEARFENIEASSAKGSSVINTETKEMAFKVGIPSFVFENGLMQEHFNETYMESDKFPIATFKGKILETINFNIPGSYPVTVSGVLTMHGISKERTFKGTLIIKENAVALSSEFIVPVSDHKIEIPNDKISNISQDIKVTVNGKYQKK